ncbi:uncharacterized protein [Rutidosis leptorrhynchoides]|uniref:uncharacterized protein n=1 Tax=Rutidosis leptorrhynchoides TaxID=125765 RepID=UPI003A990C70
MISAFGLPGRVFMTRTPKQTKNMHDYPQMYRPPSQFDKNGPSQDVLYSRTWASFGVLVDSGSHKHPDGVLEFVMDKPKDSNYDIEINLVCKNLQSLLLQPSIQIQPNADREAILGYPDTSIKSEHLNGKGKKRERVTQAKICATYFRLARCFGLSTEKAAKKLGIKSATTFKKYCREAGIQEWPYIGNTTNRAGSVNEARNNQISSTGTSYFGTPDASDDMSGLSDFSVNGNGDIFAHSTEEGKLAPGMEDIQMV